KGAVSMINARAETAASLPTYRAAFKARPCLIVADGFYEWKKLGPKKQPYFITRKDGKPFAFAGLWEWWRPKDAPPKSAGEAALRAGYEGLICKGLAAVIIEIWGEPKVLDLTASRKLTLMAEQHSVMAELFRSGAEPKPSTAETRWLVRTATSASAD